MADPKRIQLDAPKAFPREKKAKVIPPTYRFELKLEDIRGDFVEYSYSELVKEAKKNDLDTKNSASDDPFSLDDDDDQKLQEIARKLEEKYNPKPGRKKRKKLTISEDNIDKGMGYDLADPFIDNEEAYDELVPSTLTTEFGGFYINKGDLEFRNLSESENGFDIKSRKKRIKQGTEKERKKHRVDFDENHKRRGRKPSSETSALKPKKKSQPTVADMLQQHKANLQRIQQASLQPLEENPIQIEREIELENEENNDLQLQPGQTSTISEAIESVIKASAEDGSNGSMCPTTGSSDEEQIKLPAESADAPKLPVNLPPDLDDVVGKLKEVAHRSEEGKCKFFSDEVNQMLLSVELKAQELTSAQRSTIYSHLASHLPCTKETLQKRAKKLRLDQEDGKLREPMQRLKDAISAVMPAMIEKYAALTAASDIREEERKNGVAATSDGEESQDGEKKIDRMPKKRFEWNDSTRKYLCDVVRIKLKCYEVSKTRIQSAEEYLKHFLDAEVKNLWPPGWMQSRILFRESRAAHFYITNRPKKQILVSKKQITSTPGIKPSVSLLTNTIVPQETEFDQMFHDKNVPLVPSVENVLEKTENLDILGDTPGASIEERVAEYQKLFKYPIKTTNTDEPVHTKNSENPVPQTNNKIPDLSHLKTPMSSVNILDVMPSKSSSKSDKYSKPSHQNKSAPFSSKASDFNTFPDGSLASDMLARIICASLADFPYAGSRPVETVPKTPSVISTHPVTAKDSNLFNAMFSNDIANTKKLDTTKQHIKDPKQTSQDVFHNFVNLGLNVDTFLNHKNQNTSRSSDLISKSKSVSDNSSINFRLKDSIVPHSRQFAEAFERTPDTPPNKKQNKAQSLLSQVSPTSTSNRYINVNEHINDYPSSTSPRNNLENTKKIAFDIAKFNSSLSSQGTVNAPFKKRTKYSQNSKVSEQWNHFLDTNLGTSHLEGMKGFPFPVSSLPTPPPAHSSSPLRTSAHSQHNSRSSSHISPGLRSIHESKSDASNHNSPLITNVSSPDVQRRQSLIQGPWKSNPSPQTPSTSINHFMTRTSPPISNQSKNTSPNHTSNNLANMSPLPAHSLSQIEKMSAYNRSHSPLPLRASPSHASHVHSPKSSTPSPYPHFGQTSLQTHQSSHTVSPTIHPITHVRNSILDPTISTIPHSPSTSPASLNANLEIKIANPRTN